MIAAAEPFATAETITAVKECVNTYAASEEVREVSLEAACDGKLWRESLTVPLWVTNDYRPRFQGWEG